MFAAQSPIVVDQEDLFRSVSAFNLRTTNRAKDNGNMQIRLLHIRHLYAIWSGLIPYRVRLDTLSEYPEP